MYGAMMLYQRSTQSAFATQVYSERVHYPGAWNKIAVVAREDDDQAILNHALIQNRRRRGAATRSRSRTLSG